MSDATHIKDSWHTYERARPVACALNSTLRHCNTLQHTATHCNSLTHTVQHSATQCNAVQHTATHCNTRKVDLSCALSMHAYETATCCNTMQHTATHRNTPQHTKTHCNTHEVDLSRAFSSCFSYMNETHMHESYHIYE